VVICALLRVKARRLVGKDLFSPVLQIRSEDVELLVVYVHNQETIIVVDWADNLNGLSRWNRNGELVIVLEGKHHDRVVETMLHRYLAQKL